MPVEDDERYNQQRIRLELEANACVEKRLRIQGR